MKRKHLYIILIVLVILVASISLAYAALSSTLTISGNADVVASSWDVRFARVNFLGSDDIHIISSTNPRVPTHSCGSDGDCIDQIVGTSFNFAADPISKPGDIKALQFVVTNYGTIDAKLSDYTLTGLSSEQDVYLNYYVIHEDGSSISSNELLKAGESTSMRLVLEFDENVTENQLPTTTQILDLSFTMNYIQAD